VPLIKRMSRVLCRFEQNSLFCGFKTYQNLCICVWR